MTYQPEGVEDKQRKAYVGTRPCGCVTWVQLVGFEPPHKERAAVKKALKDGMQVEVMTVAEARALPNFLVACGHSQTFESADALREAALALVSEARA